MAETQRRDPEKQTKTRLVYPAGSGLAEPVSLFGRLARRDIRLQVCGERLLADVPAGARTAAWWPRLDDLLSRYAGSLAATVTLANRFAEGRSRSRVAALLPELRCEVPEILLETVGGEARLARLIALPMDGAEFDLACVACCRGLAIRAIHQGDGLTGLLANKESDGEQRGRGYGPLDAPGGSGAVVRRTSR